LATDAKSPIKKLPRHERREEMLRIAAEIFGSQGFHNTNMDEIAARCGIAKPMLYSYFGSKKGLYKAVISKLSKEVQARVQALKAVHDPEARLAATGKTLRELLISYSKVWIQARDMARSDDEIAKIVNAFRNALLDAQCSTYVEMRPANLSEEDARTIVMPYVVAAMGSAEAASELMLEQPDLTLHRINAFGNHLTGSIRRMIKEAMQAAAEGRDPVVRD